MSAEKKIFVVCGPTATGKSDFAVELALKIGGEIISADSRQIYKNCPLTTGLISQEEKRGISHHLLDFKSIEEDYSVADFVHDAKEKIKEIQSRGKKPILCGGTGFYLDSLIFDLPLPTVKPNQKLREELAEKKTEEIFLRLQKVDPERAKKIDPQNRHRIIRAIEIAEKIGNSPQITFPVYTRPTIQSTDWVGLDFPDKILKERILKRLEKRISKGMIDEIKTFLEKKVSRERLIQLGLEFKYTTLFLENHFSSQKEYLDTLSIKIFQYAKRQRTWFKRNPHISWKIG